MIILCIDAFRYSYLRETRFLKNLAENNCSGRLKTILGFRGIPTTFITGKYPEEHGVWTDFKFTDSSRFNFLNSFSFLEKTPFEGLIRESSKILLNTWLYLSGKRLFSIPQIPLSKLKLFDVSLQDYYPNIEGNLFSELKDRGVSFQYFDWPVVIDNNGRKLLAKGDDDSLLEYYLKAEADFCWFSFWGLDRIAHKFGPDSQETKKELEKIDELCKRLFERFKGQDFIIWSDHGMLPVKKIINVESALKGLDVEYFLDSTMARIRTENPEEVIKRLKNLDGRVLTISDYKKYHIPADKSYGNVIFLANPNVLIFPNFFQKNKIVRGMHGYDPSHPDQYGIYITNISNKEGTKELIDFFPMILSRYRKGSCSH